MELTHELVSNRGERVLETDREGLFKEHTDRYRFALTMIAPGSRILDAACGSGYGTSILAAGGHRVIGIDISPVAISYCREKYRSPQIEYREGSVEGLDIATSSVDVFCSFETIEHIPSPLRLVEEAWRVLRPGGLFLVSTPNRICSGLGPGERPSNPFHLSEWSLREFDAILRHRFSAIVHYGQRIKDSNKFHPLYLASKWNRMRRAVDIVSIPGDPATLARLETAKGWHPMNFLSCCTR